MFCCNHLCLNERRVLQYCSACDLHSHSVAAALCSTQPQQHCCPSSRTHCALACTERRTVVALFIAVQLKNISLKKNLKKRKNSLKVSCLLYLELSHVSCASLG